MKKPKAPKLVTVAILTTITIIFWVFFTLYNILTSKSPVVVPPHILEPIDPTLDTQTLDKLNDKTYFEEGEVTPLIEQLPTNTEPNPSGTPIPTPTFVEEEVNEASPPGQTIENL